MQLLEHLALPSLAQRLLSQRLVTTAVQAPARLHTEAVVTLPFVQLACVQTTEPSG